MHKYVQMLPCNIFVHLDIFNKTHINCVKEKEYATIDTIMVYLTLSPFQVKADCIFKGSKSNINGKHRV